MNVTILSGDYYQDPNIPAEALQADNGSVVLKTQRAEYRFTAEGWENMLLYGLVEVSEGDTC